jgi:hypothetical protein
MEWPPTSACDVITAYQRQTALRQAQARNNHCITHDYAIHIAHSLYLTNKTTELSRCLSDKRYG